MDTKQAFQIIIDLAADNILDDFQVQGDPEILQPIQNDQNEALEIVTAEFYAIDEAEMFD